MLGAPPGCIPLDNIEGFIAACQVGAVINAKDKYMNRLPSLNQFTYPDSGILVTVNRETFWFKNMSVQQFAARMVEAMKELSQPFT
jgi:5'(3')-deoxyribonucleotidase